MKNLAFWSADGGDFADLGCDGGDQGVADIGGVVHGVIHTCLGQVHGERIVAIHDEGDRG